jgi:outer membrane biogenesis lipoprotein LolB
MKLLQFGLLAIVGLSLVGCSSATPQDKAYQAQEKVHNERLALVAKYQKCMQEAGSDTLKSEACEQYLKSAEALK